MVRKKINEVTKKIDEWGYYEALCLREISSYILTTEFVDFGGCNLESGSNASLVLNLGSFGAD